MGCPKLEIGGSCPVDRDLGASELLWVGREKEENCWILSWRWTVYPYPPEEQTSQI